MSVVSDYFRHVNQSFAALHAWLGFKRHARWVLAGLLFIHTLLLGYSAYVHSPTLNEPGHLVAGLSYWKFWRFDVYSVNPPLVKMVAALPVMAVGYEEDWSAFYTGPGARPEMAMGEDFVTANGERSFFLFMIARWACIPFSWLGAIVCFLWARDLYSRQAGLMAAGIWCFEPNIVAHASLITPDAHATALGLAACYTFWRWLKKPTWTQAALTGGVLGLAELAKTTLIIFFPLWPLMWVLYRFAKQTRMQLREWVRETGMLTLRMAIGLYVLNLGYCFEGSLTRLGSYTFVSRALTGSMLDLVEAPDFSVGNRFSKGWLAGIPVPLPKHYLVGIDLQKKDFEHYDRPSYLWGEWRNHGCWYYYLCCCAIKTPLALLLLGVSAVVSLVLQMRTRTASQTSTSSPGLPDQLLVLLPAFVLFCFVSLQTCINEHLRYVLPCFPFLFVWIAGNATRMPSFSRTCAAGSIPTMGYNFSCILPMLCCWLLASEAYIYPHCLSYFNESIGGPANGVNYLSGSNLDWHQDYIYTQRLTSTTVRRYVQNCSSLLADRQQISHGHLPFLVHAASIECNKHIPKYRKLFLELFRKGIPATYTCRFNISSQRGVSSVIREIYGRAPPSH